MANAEDLGKKLLAEVEETGFDEILSLLRSRNNRSEKDVFGFDPIDQILRDLREARPSTAKATWTWPIVELMSLQPGSGKTHLIYQLCARAVLPGNLSGRQTCVIVVDADGTFSIPRLAAQMQIVLHDEATSSSDSLLEKIIVTALKHVHIFRPQSLASTTATLASLPAYLFNNQRHSSFDRQVGFIALDSASAFYWQDRAETEDATFHASTTTPGSRVPRPTSGYVELAAAIKLACNTFQCPAIFTSRHLGSTAAQHQHRSCKSSLPAAFATLPTLRLIVQRARIRKFPAGISLDAALCEAPDRQKAVSEGKFMCFVNEHAMDEQTVQKLIASPGGGGFDFRIVGEGVMIGKSQDIL